MKYSLFLLCFTLIAGSLFSHPKFLNYEVDNFRKEYTRADSAHGFDVLNYDITLEIDDQQHYIEGTVIATILAETILNQIQYELESLSIDQVLVNGVDADHSYQSGLITIDLGTIDQGEEFTTSVSYSGFPILSNDVYHLGMIFGSNYVFTLSDPSGCRWWWPSYDHPWDKAEIDFHITMRDDWLVACNGIRTGIIDNNDGTKTHHWDGSNPMTTFLACITAANFNEIEQTFEDIPIQNFVTSSYYNDALEDLSNLPYMIEVFSEKYGDYPFEKYGNAVVPMVTFGAMEHQTMTTLGASFIDGNHGGERTIAHELSHQWYGNCLTPLTWKDVWLSESFATYSEAVYTEEWLGFDAMCNYVRTSFHNYYINWMNSYGVREIYDPPYNEYFAPPVYEKGASILHMLRRFVGNETFFEILQTYFLTYHNQNVVTSEFIEICEEVTENDHLAGFFEDWIFQSGVPDFEYCWFLDDENDPLLMTYVKSNSNGTADFDWLPIPIHLTYEDHFDSLLVASSSGAMQSVLSLSDADFQTLEFDPDNWILSRGETYHNSEINNAYGSDGSVTIFWNEFWEEVQIEGYNVYRSENEGGVYEQINAELVSENFYQDNTVENGMTYYYKIKTVDQGNFESLFSNTIEVTPIGFPLDQGVLVIDETKDGTGTQGNPDDVMVDQFYQEVLGIGFTQYDYYEEGQISLTEMGNYSTVIWHDDDVSQHYINDNVDVLGNYLTGGGNLIISGWKTASEISEFFISNFFEVSELQLVSSWDFIGATSANYQDIYLDEDKLNPVFDGTLPYITIFPETAEGIYNFDGIEGSEFEGEICALKSEPNGVCFLFGFPLYFFYNEDVTELFSQIMNELGETYAVNEICFPEIYSLTNFPNPFSSSTMISFSLRAENTTDEKIEIYNIKGQKVKELRITNYESGMNEVSWDGTDETDKPVESGIYFYRLQAENVQKLKKMILLR